MHKICRNKLDFFYFVWILSLLKLDLNNSSTMLVLAATS